MVEQRDHGHRSRRNLPARPSVKTDPRHPAFTGLPAVCERSEATVDPRIHGSRQPATEDGERPRSRSTCRLSVSSAPPPRRDPLSKSASDPTCATIFHNAHAHRDRVFGPTSIASKDGKASSFVSLPRSIPTSRSRRSSTGPSSRPLEGLDPLAEVGRRSHLARDDASVSRLLSRLVAAAPGGGGSG